MKDSALKDFVIVLREQEAIRNLEVIWLNRKLKPNFKTIADFKVICKSNDLGQLASMALRAKRLFGDKTFEVLIDKGYYQAKDLKKYSEKGFTIYVTKQTYTNDTKDQAFYSGQYVSINYNKTKNTYLYPAVKELHQYLTRGKVSISAEISLSFLAYNLKKAINILGTEEILGRLRQKRESVPVLKYQYFYFYFFASH